jgi:hypothetical protein
MDVKQPQTVQVSRLAESALISADWANPLWQQAEAFDIQRFMGPRPDHLPGVQAKITYDNEHIYIVFRVEDRYVRAVTTEPTGPVWEDSCVEFFFTPGADVNRGYFNIEVNCIGTVLFRHQTAAEQNICHLSSQDHNRIDVAQSLPREVIDPERPEALIWTVAYNFPIDILQNYQPVIRPAPGVTWRGNFFKCADKTSHPHWLTWSPIESDTPDFHRPDCFGILAFTD